MSKIIQDKNNVYFAFGKCRMTNKYYKEKATVFSTYTITNEDNIQTLDSHIQKDFIKYMQKRYSGNWECDVRTITKLN